MRVSITTEERAALRAEVARFARRAVAPLVARPEAPAPPEAIARVLGEAAALGLLGADDEASGLGPWEALADDRVPGPTLDTLVEVARTSAATAFVVHQRTLARAACRMAGLPCALARPAIAPASRHGLGRRPLARWLAGAALDDEDRAFLDDVYRAEAPRVVTVEHGFDGVVVPAAAGGSVQWLLAARAPGSLDVRAHAHGLDELATGLLAVTNAGAASTLVAPRAREVFAAVAGAHQLATVAIARGAVEHALELARRYASQRYQGGSTIDRHPAVLELLGRCRGALVVVDALLERAAQTPLDPHGFAAALALRARAMPALADAANAALQVFGGIGYMRDVGAEKVVRDVNHLRAIAGPLGELDLMVAEWERLHA